MTTVIDSFKFYLSSKIRRCYNWKFEFSNMILEKLPPFVQKNFLLLFSKLFLCFQFVIIIKKYQKPNSFHFKFNQKALSKINSIQSTIFHMHTAFKAGLSNGSICIFYPSREFPVLVSLAMLTEHISQFLVVSTISTQLNYINCILIKSRLEPQSNLFVKFKLNRRERGRVLFSCTT